MYFLLGPTFSYNINTIAKGNGWDVYYQTQMDSYGNTVQILTTRNWEKNESNSKDLSKFNIGSVIGLDFMIPINKRMDFILQNNYTIYLSNITTLKKLRYTSLLTGYINLGLRYDLNK